MFFNPFSLFCSQVCRDLKCKGYSPAVIFPDFSTACKRKKRFHKSFRVHHLIQKPPPTPVTEQNSKQRAFIKEGLFYTAEVALWCNMCAIRVERKPNTTKF